MVVDPSVGSSTLISSRNIVESTEGMWVLCSECFFGDQKYPQLRSGLLRLLGVELCRRNIVTGWPARIAMRSLDVFFRILMV